MQQEPILPQNTSAQSPSPSSTTPPGLSKNKSWYANWKSWLFNGSIIVIAPLIAILLIAFVFQSYEVEGPSMEQTLQNRDRLIVWKLPRTVSRITGNHFIPKRGDIIIFIKHGIEQYDPGHDKQLIKRVIGLPGERVLVENDKVTIYNSEHTEGFNPDETLGYSHVATTVPTKVDVVVPEGQVFVMGDNRPNSLDSRSFGAVPSDDVVGTLSYRIFPVNKARSF
jgi:signal peptidase I